MNTVEMNTKQLEEAVTERLKGASCADLKWIYNYFSQHDEWPVITDEVPVVAKEPMPTYVPGEGTWQGGEECPF
tara:strand:+ start:424 stop:645 length:222 start_codon:yes stop_codon:yes gene_type:complete